MARRGAALARRRPDVLVPQAQQLLVAVLRHLARDGRRPAYASLPRVLRAALEAAHTDGVDLVRVRDAMPQDLNRLRERGPGRLLAFLERLGLARVRHGAHDLQDGRRVRFRERLRQEAVSSLDASAARVRRRVDVLVVANVVEESGDLDDARVVAAELSVDRERERADPFRVRQAVALAARLEFRPRERQRPRARVRRGGVGGRRRQTFEQRGRRGV